MVDANTFVCLHTRLAASTLNMAVESGIPFVRKHSISALIFDTVRPNATHTPTITPIIKYSELTTNRIANTAYSS